jgi:hypothetical protein
MGDGCPGWSAIREFTKIYADALGNCIKPAGIVSHPHHLRKLHQRDSWPMSLQDLLPRKPKETLRAIL